MVFVASALYWVGNPARRAPYSMRPMTICKVAKKSLMFPNLLFDFHFLQADRLAQGDMFSRILLNCSTWLLRPHTCPENASPTAAGVTSHQVPTAVWLLCGQPLTASPHPDGEPQRADCPWRQVLFLIQEHLRLSFSPFQIGVACFPVPGARVVTPQGRGSAQ